MQQPHLTDLELELQIEICREQRSQAKTLREMNSAAQEYQSLNQVLKRRRTQRCRARKQHSIEHLNQCYHL